MPNLAAFAPAPVAGNDPITTPPYSEEWTWDEDGLVIPALWKDSPKWHKLAIEVRQKLSNDFMEYVRLEQENAALTKPKSHKATEPATRYSTDYAVDWGKKKGWSVLDRERYDFRLKRHHDLHCGVDVIFLTPQGQVGVQGAGPSERKKHFDRFEQRGGVAKANLLGLQVIYLEFERGSKTPIKEERWA